MIGEGSTGVQKLGELAVINPSLNLWGRLLEDVVWLSGLVASGTVGQSSIFTSGLATVHLYMH